MRRFLLALAVLAAASAAADPFDPFQRATIDGRPGGQVPMDTAFRDQAGHGVTLRQIARGEPILLVPVQHHCPNICGATLDGLSRALASPAPSAVRVVAFGIDPREGPADAMASVRHLTGVGAPVTALVGAPADIAAVTGALGYRYAWDARISQYAHVAAIAVLTPDGRLSTWIYGVQPDPQMLRTAIAGASQGGLGAMGERLLLLCYHYDPQTGRYSPLAWTILRGVAAAVILALAALVGVSILRERRRKFAP